MQRRILSTALLRDRECNTQNLGSDCVNIELSVVARPLHLDVVEERLLRLVRRAARVFSKHLLAECRAYNCKDVIIRSA